MLQIDQGIITRALKPKGVTKVFSYVGSVL